MTIFISLTHIIVIRSIVKKESSSWLQNEGIICGQKYYITVPHFCACGKILGT